MTVSSITLADPARGISSVLLPRPGVVFLGLSAVGTVRAVSESRQGRHGTRDTTRSYDDAAFSLSLTLYAGTRALMDEIGTYRHPAARPVIVVTDTEWPQPRQLGLRYDSGAEPVELGKGSMRDVQYQWRVPAGVWEGAGIISFTLPSIVATTTAGLSWTAAGLVWTNAGTTWAGGSVQSPSTVQSPGNVDSDWQALLYGPAVGPKLANDTTGLTLEFQDSLVLAATDYVLLDSSGPSATLNGDDGQSVLSQLNWPTSDWWLMQPGANQLRYYPTSGGGSSTQALVTFRPSWACS